MQRRSTNNSKRWLAPASGALQRRPSIAFIQVAAVLRNECMSLARAAGLNLHQVAVLTCLRESGVMTHGELATRIGIDKGNLVTSIWDLARQRFVELDQDDRDRRRNELRLLDPGERFLRNFEARLVQFEHDFFECLSTEARSTLEQSLARLLSEHTTPVKRKAPGAQR